MMLFRKSSEKNFEEFSKTISSIPLSRDYLGVNCIYNKNNRIVIYYESGEKTSRGTYQLLKSYFLGYYKTKNNSVRLNGVIVSGPVISSLIVLLLIFEFIFLSASQILYSCLFYVPILLWFYFGEKKNRKSIAKYLESLL